MKKQTRILTALALMLYAGLVSADLVFSAAILDFGVVVQGDSAVAQVLLTNTSAVEIDNITYTVNSSDYLLNTCSTILIPGQSCNLYVQFAPSRKGAFIQWLTATGNTTDGTTQSARVKLEGYSQPFNNISQVQ